MEPKIISFRIGFTNVYLLIQNGKGLLVDTGSRGEENKLQKAIVSNGLQSSDLKFIFLTHTHYDHAGSAAGLKKITGAKIIVHKSEQVNLEQGFKSIPKGTSLIFKIISKAGKIKKSIEKKVAAYPPVAADLVFEEKLSLQEYGFNAEIRHIAGHTIGSSGLIVGDKAIIGDCMFNLNGKIYPGFADDEVQLCVTWKKVMDWNVKWFYPGHGKRFSNTDLIKEAKRKGIK